MVFLRDIKYINLKKDKKDEKQNKQKQRQNKTKTKRGGKNVKLNEAFK